MAEEEKMLLEWSGHGPDTEETAKSWVKDCEFDAAALHLWTSDDEWLAAFFGQPERAYEQDELADLLEAHCQDNDEACEQLVKKLSETLMYDELWNESEWDFMYESLHQLMSDRFAEDGWFVEGSNMGWTNASGSGLWQPENKDLGRRIHQDIFPDTAVSFRFYAKQDDAGKAIGRDFRFAVAHHDSPAWGEGYSFVARTEVDLLIEDAKEDGYLQDRCHWDERNRLFIDDELVGQTYRLGQGHCELNLDWSKMNEWGDRFVHMGEPVRPGDEIGDTMEVVRYMGDWHPTFSSIDDLITFHYKQKEKP